MSEKNAREHRKTEKEIEAEREEVLKKAQEMAERHEVNLCSGQVWHIDTCDGNCGIRQLTQLEVDMNEEIANWDKAGMVFKGYPDALTGTPFALGMPVDIFHLELSVACLIDFLADKGLIDKDELQEEFREFVLTRMINIRVANEDRIRKERLAATKGGILMPDGNVRKLQ